MRHVILRSTWLRRTGALAAGLLLVSCGLWMDSDALLARAQKSRAAGDLRAAMVDLRTVLRDQPQMLEARALLGEVSLQMGDVASAIRELEFARDNGAPALRIAVPLARAYLAGQRPDDALALLDSVPETTSEASLATLRGTALLALDRASEAKQVFEAVARSDPKSADAQLGLAGALASLEGVPAGLEATERALKLAPEDPRIHLARGALQMQANRFEEAEKAFRAAAAASKQNPTYTLAALSGVADSLLARGDASGAIVVTTQLQKLAPQHPVTRYLHARALFQGGKPGEALPLLEQNVRDNAQDTRSRLLLGAVRLALGDLGQAEMYLSSIVAAEPDNVHARQLLAEAKLRQSKPREALDALAPALDKPDASTQLLALAGRASLAAGATASGLQYLERSARMKPEDASAQLDLVAAHLAAGQIEEARAWRDGLPSSNDDPVRRAYLQVMTRFAAHDQNGALDVAGAAASAAPADGRMQALAGAVFAQARRFDQAKEYLQRWAKLTNDAAPAQVALGRVELLQGNPAAARRYFERALEVAPGHPEASVALAQLYIGNDESAKAIEVLAAARKAQSGLIEVGILQVDLLVATGDPQGALSLVRDLVRDAPDNAAVHVAHGRVLAAAGQYDESVRTLTAAARSLPRSAAIRYEIARTLALSGKDQAAADAARTVLSIEARHHPAIELLSRLAMRRGDWAEARRRSDELLQLAPESPGALVLAGDLLLARGDHAAAAEAYRKAGKLTADPAPAMREFEALRQGRLPDPLRPLQARVSGNPSDVKARIMLADAQQKLGSVDAAARSYEQVLQQVPDQAVALNNLAWLRHEKGDASALDLARRAHERAPRSIEITDTYAWILIQRGEVGEGMKLLAPIAGLSAPPEVRLHYAVALARSGRKAEAQAIVDSVSKLPPDLITAQMRELIASASRD